jgi:hypothetical protein
LTVLGSKKSLLGGIGDLALTTLNVWTTLRPPPPPARRPPSCTFQVQWNLCLLGRARQSFLPHLLGPRRPPAPPSCEQLGFHSVVCCAVHTRDP